MCHFYQIKIATRSFLVMTMVVLLATEVNRSYAQSGTRSVGQLSMQNLKIPRAAIRSGGPPKDGIPAISKPRIVPASQATFLGDSSRVIGVTVNGESRAWPISVLNYHEIINDRLNGAPVAVTYCPLCDSATAFDRRIKAGEREFGVSGLLYNSNVLMYDRGARDESLWSQLHGEAVSGPSSGEELKLLPVELTSWRSWRMAHPETSVMSTDTGHRRDYRRSPYESYFRNERLMFPVHPVSDRLPAKQKVLGLRLGNEAVAVPVSMVGRSPEEFSVHIGSGTVQMETDPAANTIRVLQADRDVKWMYSLWFAWHAFHPTTTVYSGH